MGSIFDLHYLYCFYGNFKNFSFTNFDVKFTTFLYLVYSAL